MSRTGQLLKRPETVQATPASPAAAGFHVRKPHKVPSDPEPIPTSSSPRKTLVDKALLASGALSYLAKVLLFSPAAPADG